MSELEQSCGNCRFFLGGTCRRFPPPQPGVSAKDWCGEWSMCDTPYPSAPESDATEAVEVAMGSH